MVRGTDVRGLESSARDHRQLEGLEVVNVDGSNSRGWRVRHRIANSRRLDFQVRVTALGHPDESGAVRDSLEPWLHREAPCQLLVQGNSVARLGRFLPGSTGEKEKRKVTLS